MIMNQLKTGHSPTSVAMQKITYQKLVGRYGERAARELLLSIEQLSRVDERVDAPHIAADEDTRIERALIALNERTFVKKH